MSDQLLFCPHCGAQQLKADARFCHACGRPLPAQPAVTPAPTAPAPRRRRRLNAWWLLPLLVLGMVAAALLAWEPARSRIAGLLTGDRPAAVEPAARAVATPAPAGAGTPQPGSPAIAPGEPAATLTGRAAATATPLPAAQTPPGTATPLPTATPRPTATPPPTATWTPSATPAATHTPPAAPAGAGQFLAVSLEGVANARATEGYVNPPLGDVVLGGVRFSLGRGGSVTTQAAPLPDNLTGIALPLDAPGPQAVYLLITGGDLFSRFAGQTVGRVRLVFGDGQVHAVDLVAGQNLREWKLSAGVIGRTTDPALTEVWRGANHFDASAAVMDMLRISVPEGLQGGRLTRIEVLDLSVETVGDLDPALNLLGVSVALRPPPTGTPTAVACRIPVGEALRPLWQAQRDRLGCPVNTPVQSHAATERFQRGRMIWRESNDMIYVLYDDGDWAMYPDIYEEGAPEPPGFEPPPGLRTPVRGFGATWRVRLGGAGARIGWATESEYAVSVLFQDFERGLMLVLEGKVYLLGDNGGRWLAP